MINLLNRRYHH